MYDDGTTSTNTAHEADERDEAETEPIMYCSICRSNESSAYRSCSMFLGTNVFRIDTLMYHWKSKSHIKCAERQSVKLQSKNADGSS